MSRTILKIIKEASGIDQRHDDETVSTGQIFRGIIWCTKFPRKARDPLGVSFTRSLEK